MMKNSLTHQTAFEGGQRVMVSDAEGGDELISRCAARCGISIGAAAEAMEFYDEHFSSSSEMTSGNLAEGLRQRDLQWWESFEKVLDVLIDYQFKQSDDPRLLRTSPRALSLALGFRLTAGADTPAELARIMGLQKFGGTSGKFTVTKMVQRFIEQLKLAKIPGQRDEKARESMAEARRKQLKGRKSTQGNAKK